MPVQHTLFGRPVPQLSSRRLAQLLGGVAIFAVVTLVFTLPSSGIPAGPSLTKFTEQLDSVRTSIPKPKIPSLHVPSSSSLLRPFRHAAHVPPVQENSTSGDSSWYTDWNWLSPFSSSVTLDENRSLLPPLEKRTPIYTYYDNTLKKDSARKEAERDLLVTWRKAWWAQGLKPVILTPAEARNNPIYQEVQLKQLTGSIETEVMRWLAWETMGSGILCDRLLFPMAEYEDDLLAYFRRGTFPQLRRFEGLGNALFSGTKSTITQVIKQALASPDLKNSPDLHTFVTQDSFRIDPTPDGVAYYSDDVVKTKYVKVHDVILRNPSEGTSYLNSLVNAHLHNAWQNHFEKGIGVLKPLKEHSTALIEPALTLAHYLANCPDSPILSSCPPNRPKCRPCVASSPMQIETLPHYRNQSARYTIGMVPHPYTTASLGQMRSTLDIAYIRREVERDFWLSKATVELLGTGVSGVKRVLKIKEAIASSYGASRSIWFTAEKPLPEDLEWYFGFNIPRNATSDGKSETPVPGPERRPKPPPPNYSDSSPPTPEELEKERTILEISKHAGTKKHDVEGRKLVEATEAWSLADSEIWKFAGAFAARRITERRLWEEEEAKFGGGIGAERKGSWWD